MSWTKWIIVLLLSLVTTACGTVSMEEAMENNTRIQEESTNLLEVPANAEETPKEEIAAETDSISPEEEMAIAEELALTYIHDFLNNEDVKGKERFVEQHVIESRQSFFLSYTPFITEEELRIYHPKVIETQLFEYHGNSVALVFIQYSSSPKEESGTKEVIYLFENSKMVSGYLPSKTAAHSDLAFRVIREGFNKTSTPPKAVSKAKDFSGDEEIAKNFFRKFLNPKNDDEQLKYYEEHIEESMQYMYGTFPQIFINKLRKYNNLEVVESVTYRFADQSEGSLILFNSSGTEIVVVLKQSKFVMAYLESEQTHDSIVFQKLREKFQTPQPA
ncbi:hypothetical protein [Paenibacillus fonticola]|uniref:hypothetical protein n=1 Tax=Paenibacillus fonticola TaxID=379896 RepID=UPI000369F482|nr:hypothetical protein [Paenibacillus fonticola]